MPSYAILGATGATGSSLLTLLVKSSDTTINAYVRSKSRLLARFPDLSSNASVHIFEGNIFDITLMASCISGVDAVFAVVATNDNIPGLRVAQDTAETIVAAMSQLRSPDATVKLPQILFLSSASLNPVLNRHQPAFLHWLLMTACSNVYEDLEHAESYLRNQRSHLDWLRVTFIQPGGLVEDEQKGHTISWEGTKPFISYLDLAAGMIEIAENGGYDWKGVCVVPTGEKVKFERKIPGRLLRGLAWHFIPGLYRVGKSSN